MKPFLYKGVTINVTDGGVFRATVEGKQVDKGSLDAMKKAIDKAAVFEPFEAFKFDSWRDDVTKFLVRGTRKNPTKYDSQRFLWLSGEGRHLQNHHSVYPATPENLQLAAEYLAVKKANDEKREAMKEEERKLQAKLQTLKPPQPDGDA